MLAWLRLIPKDSKITNGEMYGEDYPDIPDEYSYLPAFLAEAGTVGRGFDGFVPLTYQEIEAWARMTNIELDRFESVALHTMSAVYASASSDPDAECPMMSDVIRQARDDRNMASWGAVGKSK